MRTNAEDRSDEKKGVLLELQKMPIVQIACDRAKVSRSTYYRWRKEDEQFRLAADEALHNGELLINDMSETQLVSLIKDKHFPAIHLWLRQHHSAYRDKIEVINRPAEPEDLTPKQEATVKKALILAGLIKPEIQHGKSKK